LDAELKRLRQRGVVRHPALWYAKQVVAPQTFAFVVGMRKRARRARGFSRRRFDLGFSWLDLRLGVRMLVKYPGLTLIGGLALAFALFAAAGCFEFITQVLYPKLPFDEGARIVDVALLDDRSRQQERRLLHDFGNWRTELSTIEDLGAAQSLALYLVIGEQRGEPIRAAAMTGSAFRMTRVPPFLGRTIVPADESPAAPSVIVIGHDVWQSRFGADPGVIGRTVSVGDVERTVVGVMPAGFGFPTKESLWIPLRVDGSLGPLAGPGVKLFGRLAPGATLERAGTELALQVARASAERPDLYAHLHPRVMPYAQAAFDIGTLADRVAIASINLFAGLFLLLVCGNVALLLFARAAAREGEIVVRTALGASRRRILGQLFAEALVLGTLAAFVGVAVAGYGLERLVHAMEGVLPTSSQRVFPPNAFWFHASLSPRTVVYAAGVTLFAAALVSIVPGLKITSGGVASRLKRASAGGGGLRFGGIWTAVIVVQVAATVALPVVAWMFRREFEAVRSQDLGFPSDEYLTLRVALYPSFESPPDSTEEMTPAVRLSRTLFAFRERLEAEPVVVGVTTTNTLPGTYHNWRRIELDEGGEAPRSKLEEKGPGRLVRGGVVAPNYFDVLGVGAIRGRTFDLEDAEREVRTVVVNQPFVDNVLGGRNPIGRRLRYLASDEGWDGVQLGDEPGPWYRIVGVVPDLAMTNGAHADRSAGIYHATPRGSFLMLHLSVAPAAFTARLHEIAEDVEPGLALLSLEPMDQVKERDLRWGAFWDRVLIAVCGVAVLLSLAGIYAVTSFTVARRTREIGVRVALGAGPARVAAAIFRRPLMQVAGGLLMGILLTGLLLSVLIESGLLVQDMLGRSLLALLGYSALMTAVCLLACVVPMRRALHVEPSEALATEG
jgi:predicted permease